MDAKLEGKRWEKELEEPIRNAWKEKKDFVFVEDKRPVYSIDTPPPYVNTPVHIGQATTYVLMDMFARFRRMTGFNVIFPLGLDRNGLPIEMAAEKKFNVHLTELSRDDAIRKCESILAEASAESTDSFFRLGISFNSYEKGDAVGDLYHTDSPEYRSLTQDTFIDMWEKELIYEDERVNNYCPGCQTTLADAEVIYEDKPGFFHNVRFKVKETGEDIIIGTTRPELICALGMIIYNPEDDRYKHLEGKTAISPLYEKEVPIKAHPSAEIEKGTGIMMMCSFGDLTDIRFFREMQIDPVICIGANGKMNENAGFLNGMSVKEARKMITGELEKNGLLIEKIQTSGHRTPICERSKDPIEFISMSEFYVKQIEFKDDMRKIADQVNFFHPNSKQILLDWIDSVSIDWPISRRRFYATEVPLWRCDEKKLVAIPPKGKYHQPWKDDVPKDSIVYDENHKMVGKAKDFPDIKWKGEMRVFDTWFDSSISPLYILKYGRDEKFFEKHSPCTLRPQGKEIVRTWLYYTLLKDYLLTGKPIFRDVWINYHIVDEKGHKMSKSKGNIINPKDVLDRFGAEPFRLWSATEGNLERTDFRCSFDRIDGAGKTLTKLWNVSRFISMFPQESGGKLTASDKWILKEINEIAVNAKEQYTVYNFHEPIQKLKNFIWETFASHYVEMAKNRAYNQDGEFSEAEQKAACYTLHEVLKKVLKVLAPVTPFITEKIYGEIYEGDIHKEKFPENNGEASGFKFEFTTEEVMAFNSAVWKAKKDANVSLKNPVKKAVIPEKLKELEKTFKVMHKIEEMEFGDEVKILLQ
ncbi:MAG: valine--tRNA ligase [Candidatus Aenigmarchaeota archaeon]|nr:valine--tRNA ligase [Candidatus Aenigmarchaeota archaeon]